MSGYDVILRQESFRLRFSAAEHHRTVPCIRRSLSSAPFSGSEVSKRPSIVAGPSRHNMFGGKKGT